MAEKEEKEKWPCPFMDKTLSFFLKSVELQFFKNNSLILILSRRKCLDTLEDITKTEKIMLVLTLTLWLLQVRLKLLPLTDAISPVPLSSNGQPPATFTSPFQ